MFVNDGDYQERLEEVTEKLAEAERVQAVLEARLLRYQSALESIRAMAGKVLDS